MALCLLVAAVVMIGLAFRLVIILHDIARVDRCAVHESDDLVRGTTIVVHLPMGRVDVGEGCAGS